MPLLSCSGRSTCPSYTEGFGPVGPYCRWCCDADLCEDPNFDQYEAEYAGEQYHDMLETFKSDSCEG